MMLTKYTNSHETVITIMYAVLIFIYTGQYYRIRLMKTIEKLTLWTLRLNGNNGLQLAIFLDQ